MSECSDMLGMPDITLVHVRPYPGGGGTPIVAHGVREVLFSGGFHIYIANS